MHWVDPTDPSVFAAVAGENIPDPPDPELQAEVSWAVLNASEILTMATGHRVHPAGTQTEEFYASGTLRRLTPVYGPITGVTSLVRVDDQGTETPIPHRRTGNMIILAEGKPGGSVPLWRTNGSCGPRAALYRLTYDFASTVSAGARAAVLSYARELFLAMAAPEECSLPSRTTSVTREGIGIELLTPQDFLDKGRVGLPAVDTWLSQLNPKRALRPSGVYTPDSPPGVGINLRRR